MNQCPITYDVCEGDYSSQGLHVLSPKLHTLHRFPYGKSQQLELAMQYADKLSFSGVQPKLNAKLNLSKEGFEIVRSGGTFIFKLPHTTFEELPQNEDVTMKLASLANIEVPLHGLIYAVDQSLVYFIQRFDRIGRKKCLVEDFGQLANLPKEAKYDFSMEKLATVIDKFCTFSKLEKIKLFRLTLFNFLVGNEDMHVKNFSVIRDREGIVKLSPAYDLINSTIVMNSKDEIALPLNGKKSNLKRSDFLEYFGQEKLQLSEAKVQEILLDLQMRMHSWKELIARSFLSSKKKKAYLNVLEGRMKRLF
jgi:serine/threonine-protein kinase HipA